MESVGTPTPDDPRPPDETPPGPRRLTRSRTDRVLGGVCAGLGRYFGIDSALVRVLAVVLVFLGGAGLLAYLAMLLLVPEEEIGAEDPTVVQQPSRQLTAGAIVLIIVALVFGGPLIFGGGVVALGLAIPLAILALTGMVTWWLVSGEPFGGSAGQIAIRSVLGLLVLIGCGLLYVAGFLGTGFGGGAAMGAAVVAAGVVLVVGAFAGRARWVALPAVALALGASLATAANVDLQGGVGERDYRPTTDLRSSYELGVGQLVVDLRDSDLGRGDTPLKMRVGMGQAVLIVPKDVCVATKADLGAGGLDLFDRSTGGFDYTFADEPAAGRTGKRVVVDADVGFGRFAVSHDRRILDERGPRGSDVRGFGADSAGNSGCARA